MNSQNLQVILPLFSAVALGLTLITTTWYLWYLLLREYHTTQFVVQIFTPMWSIPKFFTMAKLLYWLKPFVLRTCAITKPTVSTIVLIGQIALAFILYLPAIIMCFFLVKKWQMLLLPWFDVFSLHFFDFLTVKLDFPINPSVSLTFAVDELSAFFSIMSCIVLSLICSLLPLFSLRRRLVIYLCIIVLHFALISVFLSHDLLSFFISFELTLLPMFFLIIFNGTGKNTIKATYWLLFFTLLSSIFLVIPTLYLYNSLHVINFTQLQELFLQTTSYSHIGTYLLCLCFTVAFLIKLPLMPLHIWLPEVHVEAPTLGSMILASLMLKLGGYGLIRISFGLFSYCFIEILQFLLPIVIMSIVLSALLALCQTDAKKLVAYSSIAHMSVSLLGMLTGSVSGLIGTVLSMFAHSLTAPILFFLVGCLYDRYHTRNYLYFGGLARVMPIFSIYLFGYILSNLSFPGFINFIGEIQIIYGFMSTVASSPLYWLLVCLGLLFVAAYNLVLFCKVSWGNIQHINLLRSYDVTAVECTVITTFMLLIILWGWEPSSILCFINLDVLRFSFNF